MNALSNETKLKIEKTIKNLKANKMDAYYCDNKEDACNLVKTLIKKGDVISSGGSVTLKETGVYDIITSSDYKYLDRAAEGITPEEVEDMLFANKIVKNSKSNAIVLAKGKQLLASGVGQTSRVYALKQSIEKAKSFGFDLHGAVMASDAFFPFPDCVEIADKEGVTAVIQPGGSVKDDLTFAYCNEHGMAMVTTGIRHFKH